MPGYFGGIRRVDALQAAARLGSAQRGAGWAEPLPGIPIGECARTGFAVRYPGGVYERGGAGEHHPVSAGNQALFGKCGQGSPRRRRPTGLVAARKQPRHRAPPGSLCGSRQNPGHPGNWGTHLLFARLRPQRLRRVGRLARCRSQQAPAAFYFSENQSFARRRSYYQPGPAASGPLHPAREPEPRSKPGAPGRDTPQPDARGSKKPPWRVAASRRAGGHGYPAPKSCPALSQHTGLHLPESPPARPPRQAPAGFDVAGAAAALCPARARPARGAAAELGQLAAAAAAQGVSDAAQT
nr:hypothetical protein [Tanacetum cinerariifolium]